MTDSMHTTTTLTMVAIDIGKKTNHVIVERPDGRKKSFTMHNSGQDFKSLESFLQTCPKPVRIGLEPTGDYHRVLAYRMLQAGFEVVGISSLAAARYREAATGTWDKNDRKDSGVILAMMKRGLTQIYHEPLLSDCHDLRELGNSYSQLTLARTRIIHFVLTHFLPLYFPEMERYWESTQAKWFTDFLLRFTTPAHVVALSQEEFIEQAWKLVGRKVNKRNKLAELYEIAAQSIALPVRPDSPAVEEFRTTLRTLANLNAERIALVERIERVLADNPDFERLKQVPGIGTVHALMILAETGDMKRFHHYRQYLKYCGLNLCKIQSGLFRGKEQLSKRGNARLRKTFWMAACSASRMPENSFHEKYSRYLQASPGDPDRKRKALTAVAAKIARVVFSLLKNQSQYRRFFEDRSPSGSIPLIQTVEAAMTS